VTKEHVALLNASLNGLSTILLVTAYVLVRRRRYAAHGWTMGAALVTSGLFLIAYVWSKVHFGEVTTGIPAGAFRTFYMLVLVPHVIMSIVMLPMILAAVLLAYMRRWEAHKRIAWPTFLVWAYVSVTGVLIYFILYQWYPALYPDAFKASPLFS
jgi:putative membrane protein